MKGYKVECPECKGKKYIFVKRRSHPVPLGLYLGNTPPRKPREWRRLGDVDKESCRKCNGIGKVNN